MANSKTKTATGRGGRVGREQSLFPMFVKLEGRPCLVVGAGRIAESKIPSLLEAGAKVLVVAPEANPTITEWASSGRITWEQRSFQSADLNGKFLVIAATSLRDLNAAVFHEARQRNILCNAVDDPDHCDFYYPAVVRRGALQLAISTAGLSPALGQVREELFAREIDPEQRRQLLHRLASRESFAAAVKGGTQ